MKYESFKPLKGPPRPRELLALDTEDDQLGYGPGRGFYLGAVWTPAGGKSFTTRHQLIRHLSQPRWGGWWCACHNLEYDALNVFGPKAVCLLSPCFSGSKLVGMRLRVGEGESPKAFLHFFDTSAFMPQSLKKLAGSLLNMEKLGADLSPGDRRVTAERRAYCLRDAEITYKLAHYIQDGLNTLGGQLQLTAASSSMDMYRRKYMYGEIPCLPAAVQNDLHRGYCGGRVECFRLGDFSGELFGNDFNGMYASVMIDSQLPEVGTFARHTDLDLSREGMAHCQVTVPAHLWAGPLPAKGVKLTFPVGRLAGWWCFNELRSALNYGCRVERVHEIYYSTRCEPYLRDMMLALRKLREEPSTPPAVNQLAKLCMNSLYGKFAQRAEDFRYFTWGEYLGARRRGELSSADLERTQLLDRLKLVKVVWPASYPRHSNVIWAACITAAARNKLYAHLDEGTSYYCDTDSVLGERGYPETKTLGSLALKDRYSRLVIRGNKLYAGMVTGAKPGWEAHAKGVPRDSALQAVMEPGARITSRRPVKLRTALHGMAPANAWLEVFKCLSAKYDKRTVEADGRTRPLEVKAF